MPYSGVLALVGDLEPVRVHPRRPVRIGDRLDGLVRDGVDPVLGLGVALRVLAGPGRDLDQDVGDVRVDVAPWPRFESEW